MTDKPFAIIGAGAAGLMAADILSAAGANVTVFDQMPSPARKVLMAGRGGLNLTHSEPHDRLLSRYGELAPAMRRALQQFTAAETIALVEGLGQPTFTGTSGRVFPKSMKASPLVRALLARLTGRGVQLNLRHRWTGFTEGGGLRFETNSPDGEVLFQPRAVLLALGGASWPRLGSDGGWAQILRAAGVGVRPFEASNAGVRINWSEHFKSRFAGVPLKRVALECERTHARGEVVVTREGLQGSPVYALSPAIRQALKMQATARITIDLRPDTTADDLTRRLSTDRKKQSLSNFLRKAAGLSPTAIALLREASPALPAAAEALTARIKLLQLTAAGMEGLERAISSAGGIAFDALDDDFQLKVLPGVYAAGEMLDWDAPTGGYLLQASFASAVAAAKAMLRSQ